MTMPTNATLDPMMFGLFDNSRQTTQILDGTRSVGENIVNSSAREFGRIHDNIERNAINTNQLIGKSESGIKDTVHQTATTNLSATERTGAANITSLFQGNTALMNAIERNGGNSVSTAEKVGSAILTGLSDRTANINESIERVATDTHSAIERTGALNLAAIERTGATAHNAIERMGGVNLAAIQNVGMNLERSNGDSKLLNATHFNQVEKQAGDYFAASQRNFGSIDNNLLKVENSLGRLSDQHFAASQIELLKAASLLDKNIDKTSGELYRQGADNSAKTQLDIAKLELSLAKQASENFANIQIENAKNRLGIEQKIVESGNDIKMNLLREAESVKSLINERNTEYLRDNLQNEKIIHAMDHHYGHHGHHWHHGHHGHHHGHHHRWDYDDAPAVVYDYRHNYNNNDDRRGRRNDSPRRGD
jgi:hypothetical protein